MKIVFQAVCACPGPPHDVDPETGEYLPWVAPLQATWTLANADAQGHNKSFTGHCAQVRKLNVP
jgi:hypothetical protein